MHLCKSDEDCSWCGVNCYNPKQCPNIYCIQIAPPSGMKCECVKMEEYQGKKLPAGTGVCMAVPAKLPQAEKVCVYNAGDFELKITVPRYMKLSLPEDRKPAKLNIYLKPLRALSGPFNLDVEGFIKVRIPPGKVLVGIDVDLNVFGYWKPDLWSFEWPVSGIPSEITSFESGDVGVYAIAIPTVKPTTIELEELKVGEWNLVGSYDIYVVAERKLALTPKAKDIVIGEVAIEKGTCLNSETVLNSELEGTAQPKTIIISPPSWIKKNITICIDGICRELEPAKTIEIPKPPKPEICPELYMLVCGIDGRTYPNLCEAWKNGVSAACKGECPCAVQLNMSIRHLAEIKPGEAVEVAIAKEMQLKLKAKEVAKNVQVIVSRIQDLPAGVGKPAGIVYAYFEISPISDEKAEFEGTVNFSVEKSWLSEKGISSESVKLARYNNTWEILKTEKVSEDSERIYYKAEIPGFSVFAVIAAPAATPPTPTPTPKPPTPGFEVIFAIAGLIAVAYLLRKKQI